MQQQFFRALNRVVLPAVKAGLGSPLPVGGGIVVLETTGRVTKKRRHVPLVALRIGDRVAVSTVRKDSQWFANLEQDTEPRLWMWGRSRPVAADFVEGPLNVATLRKA